MAVLIGLNGEHPESVCGSSLSVKYVKMQSWCSGLATMFTYDKDGKAIDLEFLQQEIVTMLTTKASPAGMLLHLAST
jgi:hypothetical protein